MNGFIRFAALAAFWVAALLSPTHAVAQEPLSGTWRIALNQTRFSPKPIVAFLSEGWYHCTSCNPQLDVKADGADQPVIGQAYDTISVREIDSRTIELITKLAGKLVREETRSVSKDGRILKVTATDYPVSGGAATQCRLTAARVGVAPARINGTSGEWRVIRLVQSDNALQVSYKVQGDQLTMTTPAGETYVARFDGKDYPAKGSSKYNAVSLKRINANAIQEIDKRDGVVVNVLDLTVSADGKKLTIVETNSLTDRATTYMAIKQ